MVKPRRVALRRDTFELWVPRFWKVKPEPRRPAPEFSHKRGAPCKLPDHAPSRSSRRGGPYQAPQRSPHRGGGHSSPRHSLARARDRGRWAFGTGVFGSPGNPRRTQSWGGPQQVELERANTSFSREDPGAGDSAQRAVGVGGRPSMMRGSGEVAPARLLARAERPARVEPPAARRGLVGGARASLGRECCQLAGVSPIQ